MWQWPGAPTAAATCRRICHRLRAFCAKRMLLENRGGRHFHKLLGQITAGTRPDLLMIPGCTCFGKKVRKGATQCCQVAYIVECKITSDDRVHGAALKDDLTQHAALVSRLESCGFKVQLMPIIVGSSGMILAETHQHFAAIGLTATECMSEQEHHDTAIAYLRIRPSPAPTPRSNPRRAPKRKNTAGSTTLSDHTIHKWALPAASSVIAQSAK